MTRPFFSRERVNDFAIFARHADAAVACIAARLQEGCAIDFQDAAARFTLDSATDFLFGTCLNSLGAGLPYPENFKSRSGSSPGGRILSTAERFSRAFSEAQWEISTRSRLGDTWPLWETFHDRTRKPMEIVDAYIEPILKKALMNQKTYLEAKGAAQEKGGVIVDNTNQDVRDDETLLDHLVKHTDGK